MDDQNHFTRHPVEFTGTAIGFFGVWITNLLLSLITFGIYSAWAKVRTKRYFHQHTTIDGRRFDYHATGKQILIGRVIVVIAFVLLSVASALPLINVVMLFGWLFVLPWLLMRSIRFNARMTSFSGLRFNFHGTYWGAFRAYLLYPFLSIFTLYLTMPFVIRAQKRYTISNHSYGTARLKFDSTIGPFYAAFALAIGWALLVLAFGLGVILSADGFAAFEAIANGTEEPADYIMALAGYGFLFLAILPAGFIYAAFIRNTVYNNTVVEGGVALVSDVRPLRMMWIAVTNAILSVVSLGLLFPWAQVRMTRFLCKATALEVLGDLDAFVGDEAERTSAIGDAFTDLEAFDFGIPG